MDRDLVIENRCLHRLPASCGEGDEIIRRGQIIKSTVAALAQGKGLSVRRDAAGRMVIGRKRGA